MTDGVMLGRAHRCPPVRPSRTAPPTGHHGRRHRSVNGQLEGFRRRITFDHLNWCTGQHRWMSDSPTTASVGDPLTLLQLTDPEVRMS